jgi:tetratricopeptide (TPR) repeat protein
MSTWAIVSVLLAVLVAPITVGLFAWLCQGCWELRIRGFRRRGALGRAVAVTRALWWLERTKLRAWRLAGSLVFNRHGIERGLSRLGITGPTILAAGVLKEAGELAEAERILGEALEHSRAIGAEATRGHALLLSERADFHIYRGAVADARPLLERALAVERTLARNRSADGNTPPTFARVAQAILWGADPDVAQVGSILVKLGAVYQTIGDYPAAVRAYEEAREEFALRWSKPREEIGELLGNVGGLFLEMDDLRRARAVLRHAAGYRRRTHGGKHPKYATAILDLGVWHERKRRYPKAIRLIRKAARIRTRVLGAAHPEAVLALYHLASALCQTGDYEAARRLADRAVAGRLAFGEGHPLHALALGTRAQIDVIDGRPADALARLREVSAAERRAIGRVFAVSSDAQRLGYLEKVRRRLFTVLSLVRTHLAADPAAVAEAYDLVLTRKALAAEAAAVRRDAVLGGRYPHLADRLRELSALRQQIAARVLAGPGEEGAKAHRRLLAGWQERQEQLEVELAGAIPEVGLEQRLLAADCRSVAAALPAGAVLVEYVRFDLFDFRAVPARGEEPWQQARYLAFVLRPQEPDAVRMVDLGEAGEIDRLVQAFRSDLVGGNDRSRGMALLEDEVPAGAAPAGPGLELRERVFDPIREAVGRAEHLVVATDGELAVLPLGVLPGPDGRRLVDDYRFSYLAVGRDALRMGGPLAGAPGLRDGLHQVLGGPLVIAGPDFDLGSAGPPLPPTPAAVSRDLDRAALRFPPLPCALDEGREVAALLGVEPTEGRAAVEARLLGASAPRVLHLATHGFFLPDRSPAAAGAPQRSGPESPLLRSGLALAGANTWLAGGSPPAEAGDGLLTAEEVTGLDLLGTDLVVLSACETGLGEVRAGEGVFGLRRSFQLAGAGAVVMSHPTRELMGAFYRHLLAGVARAEALRRAQREVRARYPDPRDWGAFVLQGDPGPLPPVPAAVS